MNKKAKQGISKDKIAAIIKLQLPAGQANPGTAVGPALGQHGANIQEFCKSFNDKTSKEEQGMPLPVIVTVYKDRSFTFIVKTPPASFLLRKAANIQKGSGEPNKNKVGKVTREQLKEIAEKKKPDLNAADIDAAARIIEGTARSMGLEVEG